MAHLRFAKLSSSFARINHHRKAQHSETGKNFNTKPQSEHEAHEEKAFSFFVSFVFSSSLCVGRLYQKKFAFNIIRTVN